MYRGLATDGVEKLATQTRAAHSTRYKERLRRLVREPCDAGGYHTGSSITASQPRALSEALLMANEHTRSYPGAVGAIQVGGGKTRRGCTGPNEGALDLAWSPCVTDVPCANLEKPCADWPGPTEH
jgi:hypothetical protein